MSADVESARLEWEGAYRDLVAVARDPTDEARLRTQVAVLTDELRRRVGGTYTLRQLVGEYQAADTWARGVLGEQSPPAEWLRSLTLVEGATFHLYSRGAVDYRP